MAVHVVSGGPDWKTQLAATALSWIGDAITRGRQSTENAKQAILLDQVLNGGGGGQTQTTPQPTGTQSGDTSLLGGSQLGSITAPNRDGWSEAFRSGGNPLAGFDAGISSVLPSSAQGLGTQSSVPSTQTNIPTQTEMLQRIAAAYANPRFSKWLNPKTVNELFAPYLQANEAARQEAIRRGYSTEFSNAGDWDSRVNILTRAAMEGAASSDLLRTLAAYGQYRQPYHTAAETDLGDRKLVWSFNPATGEVTPRFTSKTGINPTTKYTTDINADTQRYITDTNAGLEGRRIAIQERAQAEAEARGAYERNNPAWTTITGEDGSMYWTNPRTQQVVPMTGPDGKPIKSNQLPPGTTLKQDENGNYIIINPQRGTAIPVTGPDGRLVKGQSQKTPEHVKLEFNELKERAKALRKERENVVRTMNTWADNPNDPTYTTNKKRLEEIDKELEDIQRRQRELLGITQQQGTQGTQGTQSATPQGTQGAQSQTADIDETGRLRGDNSAVAWTDKKGNPLRLDIDGVSYLITEKVWEGLLEAADKGELTASGIKSRADLEKKFLQSYKRAQSSSSPTSSDVPAPISSDITPQTPVSGDVPAPTSSDRAILPPSPASGDVSAPTSRDITALNAASITSGDTAPEVAGTSFLGVDLPGLNPSGALSASTTPMGMTGGAPTPQTVDPDGGLTSYRVPNDNSPVTWVNANGKPMLTSDRQLFTRQVYEGLAQQADAGHFRDRGISNRADLDKWLQSVGMRPNNPSEQRGIDALNGDAARTIDIADPAITPTVQTPRDNPDRYPAPEFTDRINGTTPEALQGQLNALNGLTDDRYSQWTRALRGLPPSYGAAPLSRINEGVQLMAQPNGDRLASAPNSGVTPFSLSRSTAPEEIGTTFGGIELPGLERPGEMTASRRPMGRGRPRRRAAPAPAPAPRRRRRAAPRRGGVYTSYEEQRTAVDGAARRHGVAPELVRAVIQTESSWRPNISGPKTRWGQAKGLMQLMDGTARELGVRNPYDPAQNIEGGTKYLARLIRRYKGDISKALMAYNCGPGNVDKGRIPRASRDYARKVLGIYRQLGGR